MFRVAWGVLLDLDEAGDVAQEVFLKLHRDAARITPDAALRTWLFRVAMNEALSLRRTLLRFRSRSAEKQPQPSPEGALGVSRTAALLRSAMPSLPPKQRAVLTLHFDADLTPGELAPLVGLTPNAARVTLHRALERLRALAAAQGLEFPADDPRLVSGAAEEEC